jgi:deoxyribonuclease V
MQDDGRTAGPASADPERRAHPQPRPPPPAGEGTGAVRPEWLHPPDLATAKAAQVALAARVVARDEHGPVRLVGGVDISSNRFDPEDMVYAAVVVLSLPDLAVVATAAARARATMPYVPGFLGFREIPALLEAWARLATIPELVLVDGHGLAHPRGLGIAAHLGVVLDVPSVGVAKSLLVGHPEGPVPEEAGAEVALVWKGRRLGTVLRTKRRSNPLYVSVGHRVSPEGAVAWVRRTTAGYRLPEPTRQAHLAANAFRREQAVPDATP